MYEYKSYARIPYAYLLGDSMNLRAFLARTPLIPLRQSGTSALLIIFDLVTLDCRKPRSNSLSVRFVFYWFTECCFYLLAIVHILSAKSVQYGFDCKIPEIIVLVQYAVWSSRGARGTEVRWGREEASRGKRATRERGRERCTRKYSWQNSKNFLLD